MLRTYTCIKGTAVVGLLALAQTAGAGMVNTLVCELRGGQVVPPVTSPAIGCGTFVIDTNANTLSFYIVYDGLLAAEIAAHIHGAAPPGANAGVLFPLPLGSPKVGVWNYPEAREADILNGRMYVNIHSANHPGGEIRGQIGKAVATLDGGQENPPVNSSAGGWGVFTMNVRSNTLSYHIVLEGTLSSEEAAAHIHGVAGYGVNAGVLHPLPLGSPKVGVWNYPQALENDILQGLTYVNVHTTMHPAGEIRGQITNIVVPIDGTQEVPPVATTAAGIGFFSIDKPGNRLGFDIRHTVVPEIAAHIHGFAPPGVNAGVLFPLPAGPRKLGVWNYVDGQEDNILAGLTYVNIHSAAHPGGENRGQIVIAPKKTACPWDLDGNSTVGATDLLSLLVTWGPCDDCDDCPADFDGNCTVGATDLLALLVNWGPCP